MLFAGCLMIVMNGCVINNQPQNQANINIAQITNLKTISDMTQIAFEWERASDESVEGYILYRNDNINTNNFKKIATINDRYATHYVDSGLKPASIYQYTMSAYSKQGEGQKSQIYTISTQNLIPSVEFSQVLGDLAGRSKVLWKPHSDMRVASYIIEKSQDNSNKWKQIAEVKGRLSVEYIDKDVKPGKSYAYRIRVKTYDGVISEPNVAKYGTTKPLPDGVSGLVASNNQPKKIVLNWQANTSDEFSHYVIYSSASAYLPFTKLATAHTNSYEDYINSNGTTRLYKITSVDKYDQESPKPSQSVQGSTLAAPNPPTIIDAVFNGMRIDLSWSSEPKAIKYIINKSSKLGNHRIETLATSFGDSDLQNGVEYEYSIISVDQYGLESAPSKTATLKTEITIN